MKIKYLFLKLFKYLIMISMIYVPLTCLAKEISLYDQPKADAKVVANVDLAAGFIPIYTPKEGG